jgi:hypothetical protein
MAIFIKTYIYEDSSLTWDAIYCYVFRRIKAPQSAAFIKPCMGSLISSAPSAQIALDLIIKWKRTDIAGLCLVMGQLNPGMGRKKDIVLFKVINESALLTCNYFLSFISRIYRQGLCLNDSCFKHVELTAYIQ